MLEVLIGSVYVHNEKGRQVQPLVVAANENNEMFVVWDYLYRVTDDGELPGICGYQEFIDSYTVAG